MLIIILIHLLMNLNTFLEVPMNIPLPIQLTLANYYWYFKVLL